jgi:hypothetical protein
LCPLGDGRGFATALAGAAQDDPIEQPVQEPSFLLHAKRRPSLEQVAAWQLADERNPGAHFGQFAPRFIECPLPCLRSLHELALAEEGHECGIGDEEVELVLDLADRSFRLAQFLARLPRLRQETALASQRL